MELAEAEKLAAIAGTADGGCPGCVDGIVGRLNAAFPNFHWGRTNEYAYEQPEWSADPEDRQCIGLVVTVVEAPQTMPERQPV